MKKISFTEMNENNYGRADDFHYVVRMMLPANRSGHVIRIAMAQTAAVIELT